MEATRSDEEAVTDPFTAFYRTAWRDAARLAAALTADAGTGEELAQEAFVRLAPRFHLLDDPRAYLHTTIVNLTREWHRASGRRRRREVRAATNPIAAEHQHLFDVLAALPEAQRTVLVLRYWADWDEQAIAAHLGCRPATVRSHAQRALARLRQEVPR